METTRDYYATLGVLPSAEDVVIRAAYKALAQRYHPDRFDGSKDEALRRMQDINEAYAVLSDPIRRKAYDQLRGADTQSDASYFADDSSDVPPGNDPLESDWAAATKYYPDLVQVEARLTKIAWRLGYAFRAYLLDNKAFETCQQVAAQMEREFLELYFGTKPESVLFARELIETGHKEAAKALNEAVRIFGANIDAPRVIKKIRGDFDLNDHFSDGLPKYSPPQPDGNSIDGHHIGSGRWKVSKAGAIFLFVVACFVGIFVVDGYLKGREATARALIAQQAAQEEARKAREAIEARESVERDIQRGREMQAAMDRSRAKQKEAESQQNALAVVASYSAQRVNEGWEVRLPGYRDANRAAQLIVELKRIGIPAYSKRLYLQDGPITLVVAGPFPTKSAADVALKRLTQAVGG